MQNIICTTSVFCLEAPVRVRKNVKNLNEQEVADLNQALKKIKENGMFIHIASFHGEPYRCCPHYLPQYSKELFFFWHTIYVEQMEDALAEFLLSPVLGLPYWDWTEPWNHSTPLIGNMAGHEKNNSWSFGFNTLLQRNTFRQVGSINTTEFRNIVAGKMCERQFLRFSTPIENVHNAIHSAVGGDMSTIPYAAYDPLFFLHHSQMEKIFREYHLCQQGSFNSNWFETLPKDILDQPLECFQIPDLNNNHRTFNQTIRSVLQNRDNRCYDYETNENEKLKCSRDCGDDGPSRLMVFNMEHIQTSGKLSLDIRLPCSPSSGALGTIYIDYFGFGPKYKQPVNYEEVGSGDHPYYIDITEYLEGYGGFHNNATWLATVPIETQVTSFKDYTGENDLPLYWIDPYPYTVYQKAYDAEETVQLYWNQPHRRIIVKDVGTSIEFVEGCAVREEVWEFEDQAAYEQCDRSKLKLIKLPVLPAIGDHFYYNHLTKPRCTDMDKIHVQIIGP